MWLVCFAGVATLCLLCIAEDAAAEGGPSKPDLEHALVCPPPKTTYQAKYCQGETVLSFLDNPKLCDALIIGIRHHIAERWLRRTVPDYNDALASQIIGAFTNPALFPYRIAQKQSFGILLRRDVDKAYEASQDIIVSKNYNNVSIATKLLRKGTLGATVECIEGDPFLARVHQSHPFTETIQWAYLNYLQLCPPGGAP